MEAEKLIIINGASGSGKTFAMEKMAFVSKNIQPIKKYTTREPRSHEKIDSSVDLVFNTSLDVIQGCKYRYFYENNSYGIFSGDINKALESGKNPIVIVRDYDVIIELLNDFLDPIVIYVHSAYTGEELVRILKENGRKDIEAKERRERETKNFKDYIKYLNKDLFKYHVYNYYDDTFVIQMKYFLSKHMEVY